jgi:hypothetical protein
MRNIVDVELAQNRDSYSTITSEQVLRSIIIGLLCIYYILINI